MADVKAGGAYISVRADKSQLAADLRAAVAEVKKTAAEIAHVGEALLIFKGFELLKEGVSEALRGGKELVEEFARVGAALNAASIRTGVSADSLSELGMVAKSAGTDLVAVESGMKKSSVFMLEASKAGSEARDVIDGLGLSFDELSKMTPEEKFLAIGSAINNIEDESTRAAIAVKVFGKNGTEMLPLFASNIQELREHFRSLGLGMTTEMVHAAEETEKSLIDLDLATKQTATELGFALAPAAIEVAGELTSLVVEINGLIRASHDGINTAAEYAVAIFTFGNVVIGVNKNVEMLANNIRKIFFATGRGDDAFSMAPIDAANKFKKDFEKNTRILPEKDEKAGRTNSRDFDLAGLKRRLDEESKLIDAQNVKDGYTREIRIENARYQKESQGTDPASANGLKMLENSDKRIAAIREKYARQSADELEDLALAAMEDGQAKEIARTAAHYNRLIVLAKENYSRQVELEDEKQKAIANIQARSHRDAEERLAALVRAGIRSPWEQGAAGIEADFKKNKLTMSEDDAARIRSQAFSNLGQSDALRKQGQSDELERLDTEVANKFKSNAEKQKALLDLEEKNAIRDAKANGLDEGMIHRKFNDLRALADPAAISTRGTISGFQIQSLQGGGSGGPVERTAKATEEMKRLLEGLKSLTADKFDQLIANGGFFGP